MVLPPELERKTQVTKTIEQQITEKFYELQISRQEKTSEGSDVAFDEISKSIEVLLRGIPEAYNYLITKRQALDQAFIQERENIYKESQGARDEIEKDFILKQKLGSAKWEYRELYEEMIIDTMHDFQLIYTTRPPQISVIPSTNGEEEVPQEQESIPDAEPVMQQPQEPMKKTRVLGLGRRTEESTI